MAAWFQVKYPHLVLGSLAASAPVDIYPGENKQQEFFDAGMYVYGKFGSPTCEKWIRGADECLNCAAASAGATSCSGCGLGKFGTQAQETACPTNADCPDSDGCALCPIGWFAENLISPHLERKI